MLVFNIVKWVVISQIVYKQTRKMFTYDSLNPIIAVKKASDIK